jgi:hypothetical protein
MEANMTIARTSFGIAGFLALAFTGNIALASSSLLPMDSMTEIHGVNAVCAGVSAADRQRAEWQKYPVKFEFAGGYGQYLGDETLTVTGKRGREVVNVQCEGPWVMMNLTPGRYSARADVPGALAKSVSFTVPRHGQKQIVLRFASKKSGEEYNKHA